ncbi:hypothetical protein [Frigoribacterium sp. VKM Ac-2530]|uniref:hypothetical protein n=1 Tax=Frigoribacterium sp. VKM Ac-2530 TaxID=2783822 RepID=UPI00188DA66B|nr:hypothetical protein [Frigoribacterium sp. VKM Ac-2530]MBF4578423.1 hypothetical protein [Frigoribacterium sp. VKM Ac-2530]
MTDVATAVAHHDDPLTARTRAVTRSTGQHPGDWGRAVSLALEYLATQVAFRDGVPEDHVLEGRDVLLQAVPSDHGVEIVVELAADRVGHLDDGGCDDRSAAAERRLRDSVGYAPGRDPRAS